MNDTHTHVAERCHCCGQLIVHEEQIPLSVDTLRDWCRRNGHVILPVDRVKPETAAAILGVTGSTLRNRRSLGLPPAYIRARRGLCSYSLADLAAEFFTNNHD